MSASATAPLFFPPRAGGLWAARPPPRPPRRGRRGRAARALGRASVEALRRLGIEARPADLTTLDEPGRFAVISLADVLEHMPFPKQGLAAAHRLLRPDG